MERQELIVFQNREINKLPHSLRRVNVVAAMKKTIEIATQKCLKQVSGFN